jgi:hypothetical protein
MIEAEVQAISDTCSVSAPSEVFFGSVNLDNILKYSGHPLNLLLINFHFSHQLIVTNFHQQVV